MPNTPEGKVKNKIKALLQTHRCYYFMPVQNGYGASSLDFICCAGGQYFAIEAKAKGGKLSERQKLTIEEMKHAGATVFVIDGEDCADFSKLTLLLAHHESRHLA